MFDIFMTLFDLTKKQRSVGLDIADHTIEAAELERKGGTVNVVSVGRIKLAPGAVVNGRIRKKEKLAWAVREVFLTAKPSEIKPENLVVGLSENQVYTHIVRLKSEVYAEFAKSKNKVRDAIEEELLRVVPINREDLVFSYKTLARSSVSAAAKDVEILTVSCDKKVILEWHSFFMELGWDVKVFDIEMLALRRALMHDSLERNANFMIVDIGEVKTSIAIFDTRSQLRYSHTFPIAGDAMRDEIASVLGTTRKKAEELKIKVGLSDPSGKVFAALLKVLEKVSGEIETSLKYYREKSNKDIREVIFVGGSSQLIGLTEYFGTNLGLGVSIGASGEVIVNLEEPGGKIFDISKKPGFSNLLYLEAVGLAMRPLEERWSRIDPVFTNAKAVKKISREKEKPEEPVKTIVARDIIPPADESAEDFEEIQVRDKPKKHKKILLLVLVLGIIGIFAAFFYREYERDKAKDELEYQLKKFEENLTILKAKIKELESAKEIEVPAVEENVETTTEEIISETEEVTILETPTGWLNARDGPGTSFAKIDLVYPGESYPLLEKQEGWYKIKLDIDKEGWITAEYAIKD